MATNPDNTSAKIYGRRLRRKVRPKSAARRYKYTGPLHEWHNPRNRACEHNQKSDFPCNCKPPNKGKTILANIRMHGTIPLNGGLFFALDERGEGRLHDNCRFYGYTGRWHTAKRGECWRAKVFGLALVPESIYCDSQQSALLALIRLAQRATTGGRP